MQGLTLREVRKEIVALLDESTKELQNGNSQMAVTCWSRPNSYFLPRYRTK
jgi:hypothetical protein